MKKHITFRDFESGDWVFGFNFGKTNHVGLYVSISLIFINVLIQTKEV